MTHKSTGMGGAERARKGALAKAPTVCRWSLWVMGGADRHPRPAKVAQMGGAGGRKTNTLNGQPG